MFVTTRSGKKEPVQFDKITHRISQLTYNLDPKYVDAVQVAKRTINGLFDGITTDELDNLSAEVSAYMTSVHPDYARLAGRIAVRTFTAQLLILSWRLSRLYLTIRMNSLKRNNPLSLKKSSLLLVSTKTEFLQKSLTHVISNSITSDSKHLKNLIY